MPKTTLLPRSLLARVAAQDGLVTARDLEGHDVSRAYAHRRVASGRWQRLLPGVWLTSTGAPTRRQRVIAAFVWAGNGAAIDGASACDWYGIRPEGFRPDQVQVVVPLASVVRTHAFVQVRRALADIRVGGRTAVAYVDAATAFVVAARQGAHPRRATAILSRALQQGLVTTADLAEARARIGDKWCRGVDAALVSVGVGLRSPAEGDAREVILTSRILPEPSWNQWLDLGDGGYPLCADALWEGAGMVNEVLGRRYHAWGQQFESTEARRSRLVAAGLAVQGCTATQLRTNGLLVLTRLERTYLQNAGRGMPPGVRLIDPPHNCGSIRF